MTQEIYWELLAWLFRSFLAVTTFAFVVAGPCAAVRGTAASGESREWQKGPRFPGVRAGRTPGRLTHGFVSLIFRECPAVFRMKPPCPP